MAGMQLVPLGAGAGLPAYAKKRTEANADFYAGTGPSYPVLSIKGKVFALVQGGERRVITRPDDPDSAASYVDVVLVRANRALTRVYYAKGYVEGESDGSKPTCFSNDGERPDPQVETPQAKSCAACPHSVWGSRVGDNGQKGRSCQESKRLAIVSLDHLREPMLLRVPPASLRPLADYAKRLDTYGTEISQVATRLSFDMELASPKLTFKPLGVLPPEAAAEVEVLRTDDVVKHIIGVTEGVQPEAEPEGAAPETAQAAPAAQQEAPAAEKPKRAAKATKATPAQQTPPAQQAAPAPQQQAAPAAAAPAAAAPAAAGGGNLDAELDALLSSLDD